MLKSYATFKASLAVGHPSRIHPLNNFGPNTFVMRDDELYFGTSGTKSRKFSSLFYHIKLLGIKKILALGGAYSNNLLGIALLCRELNIDFEFIMPKRQDTSKGNARILSYIVDPQKIHTVPSDQWLPLNLSAIQIADALHDKSKMPALIPEIFQKFGANHPHSLILAEGAFHPFAAMGLKSLAHEILDFERINGIFFNNIYIDSGTGLSAQVLISSLGDLKNEQNRMVNAVMMADIAKDFSDNLDLVGKWLGNTEKSPYSLLRPAVGASFGGVPATVFSEIKRTAKEEGILLDPIYTAKLFYTCRSQIKGKGFGLIIHSGGNQILWGYDQ